MFNRNNTERRAARECREAEHTLAAYRSRKGATMDQGRAADRAVLTLKAWRRSYPEGIPGEGAYHDGIPEGRLA